EVAGPADIRFGGCGKILQIPESESEILIRRTSTSTRCSALCALQAGVTAAGTDRTPLASRRTQTKDEPHERAYLARQPGIFTGFSGSGTSRRGPGGQVLQPQSLSARWAQPLPAGVRLLRLSSGPAVASSSGAVCRRGHAGRPASGAAGPDLCHGGGPQGL